MGNDRGVAADRYPLRGLLELTHHSITEYRLPSTGELVPLLQIAPSKTDTERLLLVSPELADVLSSIVTRLRGPSGAIPLVPSYDIRERVWNPPMSLLFNAPSETKTGPTHHRRSGSCSSTHSPPQDSPVSTVNRSSSRRTTSAGSSSPMPS